MSNRLPVPKQPGPAKSFLAGGAGGICLVLVGHPLDTIKVRIQTMQVVPGQPPPYKGLVDCATKIVTKEGFSGLYKGMGAPLAGVVPMCALCFLGYGYGKKIFCDDDAFEKLKLTQIGLAGAFSALFTTPILGPGERLKCVLQIQAAPDYKGPKYNGYNDMAKSLYKEEYLKRTWSAPGQKGPSPLMTFIAGGCAGMANWLSMIPIDTVKSRFQVAPEGRYSSVLIVAKEIMMKEGVAGFFKGLSPVLVRAFPANAACFLGYEAAASLLTKMGLE